MQKRALPWDNPEPSATPRTGKRRLSASALSECFVTTKQLPALIEDYLAYCEIECHSPKTIAKRRGALGRLQWFLDEKRFDKCGVTELRRFFAYLSTSHLLSEGRWGKGDGKQWKTPMRPVTIKMYWLSLSVFFNYLVDEDFVATSPLEAVPCPDPQKNQIDHFTVEQVSALLRVAQVSNHPKRDTAIVRLLLATGLRASELCALTVGDIDLEGRTVKVQHGKGDKSRTLSFSLKARKALLAYMREGDNTSSGNGKKGEKVKKRNTNMADKSAPLFPADRGRDAEGALTARGLHLLIKRLGEKANLQNVRCSPHTFRHTYAYEFLRAEGNAFTLMHSLGHTSLTITNNYVKMAEADVVQGMRKVSPDDRF